MKHNKLCKGFIFTTLAALIIALPAMVRGVETGTGTNQVANLYATNSITLRNSTIREWPQGGDLTALSNSVNALTATVNNASSGVGALNTAVSNLNTATNLLNIATNTLQIQATALQGATSTLNLATNALQTQATALQGATNTLNSATNTLQTQATALQGATNTLNLATNALQTQATALQGATNSLHSSVNQLNAGTNRWNNAVIMKQGDGSISFSNLYYYKSDGSWALANATTNTTASGLLGLALGGSVAADGLLLNGTCTNNWGFTAGAIIYMGTNNGALATAMPTGTNNIVRIVGYAISTTNIYFNPDRTYIEILGQ